MNSLRGICVCVCVLVNNTWTSWEEAVGLRVHDGMIKGTCATCVQV